MVGNDSVLVTKNGFFTADRINVKQHIYGMNGLTLLERIEYSRGQGILIETLHHSIIVSPHQKFYADTGFIPASELNTEDLLATGEEFEKITNIVYLDETFDFLRIVTRDGSFKANGFLLVN